MTWQQLIAGLALLAAVVTLVLLGHPEAALWIGLIGASGIGLAGD